MTSTKPIVFAFVFARGGSKGIPHKNLQLVGDTSLIGHSIDTARASRYVDEVFVSTDSPAIADEARALGARVPGLRPSTLATDTSPEWLSWQHEIRQRCDASGIPQFDVFVSIPPTAPLRIADDVDACIECLVETDADVVVTTRPAERSPWFNMVRIDDKGYASIVIEGASGVSRRQDAPRVFDLTTVAYAADPAFVLRATGMFDGRVRAVVVPRERAIDIDDQFDLDVARFLYERRWAAGGKAPGNANPS